jgi:hypothetical protein
MPSTPSFVILGSFALAALFSTRFAMSQDKPLNLDVKRLSGGSDEFVFTFYSSQIGRTDRSTIFKQTVAGLLTQCEPQQDRGSRCR